MLITRWLTATALAGIVLAGAQAPAGLFDSLRDGFKDRDDRRESLTVADKADVGKFVTPVSYQPLAGPGADGPLTPVPEPYPSGPIGSPTPSPSYYPPAAGGAYPVEGLPAPGYAVEGYPSPGPVYPVGPEMGMGMEGYPLFDRVRVKDRDHIHPCAVEQVVQILDPCTDDDHHCFLHRRHVSACDACQTCGPKFVYVKICVPPGCPKVKVRDDGHKVKYDYGDYQVEIESEDGLVTVDYDD